MVKERGGIMSDWNPQLYLKFKKERTQPVYDLIARIELEPKKILDIGCGPGNSTAELVSRFPEAEITGIDYSGAMIERAENECPGAKFLVCDAGGDMSGLGTFDLVFANASLQWIPDHERLFKKIFSMLRKNGAIAFQIPQFDLMPAARAIDAAASLPEFRGFFENFSSGMVYYSDKFYYDIASSFCGEVFMWSTEYYHVLDSHEAMVEWFKSTALRPYTDKLPKESLRSFFLKIQEKLQKCYPRQKNGKVLLPFKRLFILAYVK